MDLLAGQGVGLVREIKPERAGSFMDLQCQPPRKIRALMR